ncbi:hypothetical protein BJ546DRAFT_968480 [Cryomyces antarcticus]
MQEVGVVPNGTVVRSSGCTLSCQYDSVSRVLPSASASVRYRGGYGRLLKKGLFHDKRPLWKCCQSRRGWHDQELALPEPLLLPCFIRACLGMTLQVTNALARFCVSKFVSRRCVCLPPYLCSFVEVSVYIQTFPSTLRVSQRSPQLTQLLSLQVPMSCPQDVPPGLRVLSILAFDTDLASFRGVLPLDTLRNRRLSAKQSSNNSTVPLRTPEGDRSCNQPCFRSVSPPMRSRPSSYATDPT